jgi:[acyl-carrier-protein] S-malonyltransferase
MGVAVIFPGQGSPAGSFGKAWLDDPAWRTVERLEAAAGEPLGQLLLSDESGAHPRTRDAQLAVLTASLVAWESAREAVGDVTAFAGHSLGQITALIAAGALTLEDGVALAVKRANHTQAAADARPGALAALLGATTEQAEQACAGVDCWVANDNGAGQVVIGGTPEGLEAASEAARELGIRKVMPLPVGGAFHTPLMEAARTAFAADLATVPLADSAVPVVSNGDGRDYVDGEGWRERLADHLVRPVRWAACMARLAEMGADTFVEVGPAGTLAGLVKRAVPGATIVTVARPEEVPAWS